MLLLMMLLRDEMLDGIAEQRPQQRVRQGHLQIPEAHANGLVMLRDRVLKGPS